MATVKTDYKALIEVCDQDLKSGNGKRVASRLEGLNPVNVARPWRRPLARTCRRAGLVKLGLKLLTPVTADDKVFEEAATPEEIVEYAALLNLNGSTQDALLLLSSPSVDRVPDAHLIRAFCHFGRWEPNEAIPQLKKYLDQDLEPYARLVGQVNLASANVDISHSEAGAMLDELIASLNELGSSRLAGNCWELRAQVFILEGHYSQAEECLRRAEKLLGQDNTFYRLFIRKWTAVSKALSTGETDLLKAFRTEALEHQEWEGVREADLFLQKVNFDPASFCHLYFGSPFTGYRNRIQTILNRVPEQEFYRWGPGNAPCLDITTGEVQGLKAKLAGGKQTHKLIEVLLRDLYRPINTGALFESLFPEEHFNIFSSPFRVRQALFRGRKWITKNKLPIQIIENQGRYHLSTSKPFAFLLPLQRQKVDWYQTQFEKLIKLFPDRQLHAPEACQQLQISRSSFFRLVKWGEENHKIQKSGKGIYSTYLLKAG